MVLGLHLDLRLLQFLENFVAYMTPNIYIVFILYINDVKNVDFYLKKVERKKIIFQID